MVRLLRLNKNLDAKGLQNPGVDEAERDAVNIGHGVGGQGGQALDDNLSKVIKQISLIFLLELLTISHLSLTQKNSQ